MSWVKIDDQFFMHPKVIAAGRDARDLYLAALTYTAGQLTDRIGTLSTDWFVNLLDLGTTWSGAEGADTFEGTGANGQSWTGTRADLVFASNSELRSIAEVYAPDDAAEKFVHDFVAAWAKVMDNDRFDLKN